VGGVYETVQWSAVRNPWIIYQDRVEIRNDGLISVDLSAPPDVLFISGDIHKGWLPNPLGLLMLLGGMVLILRQR
jgi:hypothetical protein